MKFSPARFIKSAVWPEDYPEAQREIAVVGRSNVGKSSLLNNLFGTKKLVKTSSTPGKTQLINFFSIDEALTFADLPGYGFAKVPPRIRKNWGPMMQKYFESRTPLSLILLLFDIRRTPNQDDEQMLDWIVASQKPFLLILTKVDKLNQKEKRVQTERIREKIGVESLTPIHYSVPKQIGKMVLIQQMQKILEEYEAG